MSVKYVYSQKTSIDDIIIDIKNGIEGINAKLIMYFASSIYNQDELSKKLKEEYSSSQIIGCSTSGEIISGKMLDNSVVVMALDSEVINDVKIEVVENISNTPDISSAFKSFEEYYNQSMAEMDFTKYVGMILIDGLSLSEEKVMDKIGDLTDVTFIGGSAGDDLKFEKTYVYANGKCYSNAVVLALMEPKNGFDIIKTQSFKSLNKKLNASKVNEAERKVIEFNNRPAAEVYAELVGTSVENISNKFMENPLGLISDNEIFVRSPQIIQDKSIKFYCNILEGMDVYLLESGDIIKDTGNAIRSKINSIGKFSVLINFNCILRTLELKNNGLDKEYGALFENIPTIGFSTYGEAYIGHINQTATMLILK